MEHLSGDFIKGLALNVMSKYSAKLERLIMDKRTNLFDLNEDEEEGKKFYCTAIWVNGLNRQTMKLPWRV